MKIDRKPLEKALFWKQVQLIVKYVVLQRQRITVCSQRLPSHSQSQALMLTNWKNASVTVWLESEPTTTVW